MPVMPILRLIVADDGCRHLVSVVQHPVVRHHFGDQVGPQLGVGQQVGAGEVHPRRVMPTPLSAAAACSTSQVDSRLTWAWLSTKRVCFEAMPVAVQNHLQSIGDCGAIIESIISLVIDGHRGEVSDSVECSPCSLRSSSVQIPDRRWWTMSAIVGLGIDQGPEEPIA